MLKIAIYIFIINISLLSSCVQTPEAPEDLYPHNFSQHGAYVLCEGLLGRNNSTLTRIDFGSEAFSKDYFSYVNPGFKLGDTANDIILKGDTAYIAVTASKSIEIINIRNGRWLGKIQMPSNSAPRYIAIINDTLGYVSDLYNARLIIFNPSNFTVNGEIKTGPAPEDIVYDGNYVYCCNSGYGDYLQHLPGASTISVINAINGNDVLSLKAGVNPVRILANPKNDEVLVLYKNLPSKKDSLGGIIIYKSFSKSMEIRFKNPVDFTFAENENILLVLTENKVFRVDTRSSDVLEIIDKSNENNFFYSIAFNSESSTIWLGNSKNYQSEGQALVFSYNLEPKLLQTFECGVNPNKILFY